MKLFLALLTSLMASPTYALDAKLSLQGNVYDQGQHVRPLVGLGLYQKLARNVAINAWTGMSEEPFDHREDATWFVAKGQFDIYHGPWTFAPGYQIRHLFMDDPTSREYFYFRVDYKLF